MARPLRVEFPGALYHVTSRGKSHGYTEKQKQSPPRSLGEYDKREWIATAMAKVYLIGHYTLEQVGVYFGCSYATVSQAVKVYEIQM